MQRLQPGHRIVGRGAELERLATWARDARLGGLCVLVGGEAGIGKTSLVDTMLAGLPARSPVLRGACEALSTPRPLAPLLDVAGPVGELAGLLAAGSDPVDVYRSLLDTLRRSRGTVLVLEDIQWADDGTLDLLRYVARRLDDVPALVLATYRDDEIDSVHPLRLVLGDLATRPTVRRLRLVPLSERSVSEIVGTSSVDTHELWHRTGGNPFFVTEVLAAGGTAVPSTVSDAVLARTARLPPAVRRVLDAAAVLDGASSVAHLCAVATEPPKALDHAVAAGMLVARDGVLRFRHELARLAVYGAIPPGRRVELHAAALRVLAEGGSTALLAHHAEAAGDRTATRHYALAAAAHAVRLGSHRQAADQYLRALQVLDVDADRDRADLLDRCSRECALSNRMKRATAHATESLRLWRALGDRRREGDTLSWLSRLAWMSERVGDAERLSRAAVHLLDGLGPGVELARALATLAQQLATDHARAEALTVGARALVMAEDHGAADVVAQATIDIGLTRALADDPAGTDQIERGVELARVAGSDDHAARGLFQLVRSAAVKLHHADVDDRAAAAQAFCDERGVDFWGDYATAFRAQNLLLRGRWDEAERLASDLWRRVLPSSPGVRTITLALTLGQVRLRRGQPDPDGTFAVAADRALGFPMWLATLGIVAARAEAAWLAGRLPSVVDDLRAGWADRAASDGWWNAELLWWLHVARAPEAGDARPGFAGLVAGGWGTAAKGFGDLGLPYHRAMALAESNEEGPLREALAIARELGAPPLGRLVARRLRTLGVRDVPRVGRSRDAAVGVLTARERDVLGLMAEGLRDSEIAARLHLSKRTVNHHVSAVLHKFAATSRTAAVAAAARAGVLPVHER